MVGGTRNPFFTRVIERDVKEALKCITNGAEVNQSEPLSGTALHIATEHLDLEMVRMLLENGAKTDVTEIKNHTTPLHYAARSDHYNEIIAGMTYLFNNKKLSKLPTEEELRAEQLQIIDLLIKHGAKLEEPSSGDRTPLHIAATGHVDIANHLMAKGANKEALATKNQTPLHFAAKSGKTDIVKSLISKNVNKEAIDSEGHTPVHLAIINGHPDTVAALLENGANANTVEAYLKNHPAPQKPKQLTPPPAEKIIASPQQQEAKTPSVQVPPNTKALVNYQVNWKPYCLATGLGMAGIGLLFGLGASTLFLSTLLATGVMAGLVKARNAYLNKASTYYSNASMISSVTDKGEQEALKIGIQAHSRSGFLWSFTQRQALRHPIAATAGMKARLENQSDLTTEISKLPGMR